MREDSIFLAALDCPTPADRAVYLDEACGGDAALRKRLQRLLDADSGGGILDTAAASVPPRLAQGLEFAGRYRLVRKLGAGGMGEVWQADQNHPVRRPVAIKFVHPRFDPTALLARFDRERQLLAVMDHPNIARVYDAGVADGLPYLAMELVGGVPVTNYCDEHALTVRERLELVVPICRAIQHAHQKGVIHRDIKPSNILISEVDGRPAPKVIDFGIAKGIQAGLTGETLPTGHGAVLGTPEYMSPEQARGSTDVDTQTDVYALGVLLYELLTGSPPFKASGHGPGGLIEHFRAVCEDDPPTPSLHPAPDPAKVATARSTDPRRLRTLLRGDLDRVLLKTLEKDRGRRYDSPAALALDLERYLAGEPVTARSTTGTERTIRWARRNPVVAVLATTVGVLLLAVAIGATMFAVRLQDALEESEKVRGKLTTAQNDTRRQLWQAQLNRALATTQSGQPGQRSASLAQLGEALAGARVLGLSGEDRHKFRDVAVAALALPELEIVRDWEGCPPGTVHLAVDSQGKLYARADQTGAVSVRRVEDDLELYRVTGAGRSARIALNHDGTLLAVAMDGGSGKIYRLTGSDAVLLYTIPMDTERVPHFTPDGVRLVYTAKATICSFDVQSGKYKSWPLPGKPWGGSALSADGQILAIGAQKARKAVVHVRSLSGPEIQLDIALPDAAEGVAWHPHSRVLAVIANRQIRLVDVNTGQVNQMIEGLQVMGGRVGFDATGERLYSNDWSGNLRMWDWRAKRQLLSIPSFFPTFEQFRLSNGFLFVHGATQTRLRILRSIPGRERRLLGKLSNYGPDAVADPLGRFLLLAGSAGTIAVDPNTGEERSLLVGEVRPIVLTPKGDLLTTGPGNTFYWPRRDDEAKRTTQFGPPEWIGSSGGSASERHGGSADGRVVAVPNFAAGAVILHRNPVGPPTPTGPQDQVRNCAVSADGRWVASGSHDCTSGFGAKVWNARTGELAHAFQVPGMCHVAFSPDQRWLVTGGGGVRLWKIDTWEEGPIVSNTDSPECWAFAPAGRILAIGSPGAVRLVRMEDGKELVRLPHTGSSVVNPRNFSADGASLYVTDPESGGLAVWDLRRLRQGLAELDLDWDAPALAPETVQPTGPWRVEFTGTDRVRRTWDTTVNAAWADPTDAEVRTRLAALSPQPTAALMHATLALALDPKRTDARYYRARANLQLKKYSDALSDAEAVLQAVPGHLDATRIRKLATEALRSAPLARP